MKSTLLALSLCAAFFCRAQAQSSDTNSASSGIVNEIKRLEADWNKAHLSADADTVEKLSADDLKVFVPGMSPIGKSGGIGALRGRMKFSRYETTQSEIRVYNADTAIVTGRMQRTRSMGEKAMEDDWRFTKVWVRISNRWQVVSFEAVAYVP
jgi:uncharacterized protein (TIGR02246 family)